MVVRRFSGTQSTASGAGGTHRFDEGHMYDLQRRPGSCRELALSQALRARNGCIALMDRVASQAVS